MPTNCHSWTGRDPLRSYVALHLFTRKAFDLICIALPNRDSQIHGAMDEDGYVCVKSIILRDRQRRPRAVHSLTSLTKLHVSSSSGDLP